MLPTALPGATRCKPLTGLYQFWIAFNPRRCRGIPPSVAGGYPYGVYFVGINTKQKYFFVLGWMQIQGSMLECAWGRTNVCYHHMSSAADAVGAPANRKNKKKAGDYLLSHIASHAVPSTQKSLTSEFGMGSGMASSLLSPARLKKQF